MASCQLTNHEAVPEAGGSPQRCHDNQAHTVRCASGRAVTDNAQNTLGEIHLLNNKLERIQDYVLTNGTLAFLHHSRPSQMGRKVAGRTGVQTIASNLPPQPCR